MEIERSNLYILAQMKYFFYEPNAVGLLFFLKLFIHTSSHEK